MVPSQSLWQKLFFQKNILRDRMFLIMATFLPKQFRLHHLIALVPLLSHFLLSLFHCPPYLLFSPFSLTPWGLNWLSFYYKVHSFLGHLWSVSFTHNCFENFVLWLLCASKGISYFLQGAVVILLGFVSFSFNRTFLKNTPILGMCDGSSFSVWWKKSKVHRFGRQTLV